MATILRLTNSIANKQFLSQITKCERQLMRPLQMSAKPYQPPPQEDYDVHNMKLGRPQSPHLTIYKPQITSILSISHRMAGMTLSGVAAVIAFSALAFPGQLPMLMESLQVNGACLYAMKFSLAFPMSYHFFNGIRHLTWDTGRFLNNKDVYTTGYIMLAVSTAAAIIVSAM